MGNCASQTLGGRTRARPIVDDDHDDDRHDSHDDNDNDGRGPLRPLGLLGCLRVLVLAGSGCKGIVQLSACLKHLCLVRKSCFESLWGLFHTVCIGLNFCSRGSILTSQIEMDVKKKKKKEKKKKKLDATTIIIFHARRGIWC